MKVTGCKHLAYNETEYVETCTISGLGSDKAVWERRAPSGFSLCQFCNLRGRINGADSCTTKSKAQCNEYEDHEHTIIFRGEA